MKTREIFFSKERDDLNQILLQKENEIKEFQKANADLQSKINQTHLPIPNNDQNEIKELKDKINKLEKQIEGYIWMDKTKSEDWKKPNRVNYGQKLQWFKNL